MIVEASADHLGEPLPILSGAGGGVQTDESFAAADESLKGGPFRFVQQGLDIAGIGIDQQVVAAERIVTEDRNGRGRVGGESVFVGQLQDHGCGGRNVVVYVSRTVPAEYQDAFAGQIARSVVFPVVGT